MPVSNPLILCVDDEVVGLEVRRAVLEHAGYRVLTAQNGRTGLDIFRQEPVRAVVLDYAMPDMSGGEVAGHMRQVKPEVPIMLLSAYLSLPPQVTEIVDVFVTKGEGAPALLDRLNQLLDTTAEPAK